MTVYTRQGPFVAGGPPGISAAKLNAIEDGILAVENKIDTSLSSPWRVFLERSALGSGFANDLFMPQDGVFWRFGQAGSIRSMVRFDPGWFPVPGKQTKMVVLANVFASLATGGAAGASIGTSFTAAFRVVTNLGAAAGTEPSINGVGTRYGATGNITPTQGGNSGIVVGPEFDAPPAGSYVCDLSPAAALPAGCYAHGWMVVLMRHA
jgi:hypothetical protein